MKTLLISRGQLARVDDDVFEWASKKRWTAQKRKYTYNVARYEGKKYVYLHRLILGAPEGIEVNHIDGDGLNNLRTNLELVTHAENQRAFRTLQGKKTSRYRGVYWSKVSRKWQAKFVLDGKENYLGLFEDETEVARTRDLAVLAAYGPIAHLNFPV